MRTLITSTAALLICGAMAQQARTTPGFVSQRIALLSASGVNFQHAALLAPVAKSAATDALWKNNMHKADVFSIDAGRMAHLLVQRPAFIALDIPTSDGTLSLDLERVDITTDDFSVTSASTGATTNYMQGAHYRGMVHGDPYSLVAISVFDREVMGIISDAGGDRVIGRLTGDAQDRHILYRAKDLTDPIMPTCGTVENGTGYTADQLTIQEGDRTAKCVRLYWEVNYDIFQDKGSVTNATNYVTGLFNQNAAQYANDGISVLLSQVFVWDVASPYTSTSTSTLLNQFGTYRTSFNGDLANLLGYAGGGGIAYVNELCASSTSLRMCYCGIDGSYSNVPTYSWSVEVVSHEQGHLMGSQHTHACVWNGNSTAIDGCGPTYNSIYTEGSCATGPIPSNGGTIMSYCHLLGTGINFANGFGPQPLAVIVNNINNATCLTACSGGSCGIPSGLGTSAITTTSATLNWGAVTGATSYTLQWKLAGAGTWTTVTGLASTNYNLTGLAMNIAYKFQVLATCSGGASAYSAQLTFNTLNTSGCTDPFEPNETNATARSINANSTINGIISSSADKDWFQFANSASQRNIKVTLTNLPADYDLKLFRSTTQLAISQNTGTTNEQIIYNTNSISNNYRVKVYPKSTTFNSALCYTLTTLIGNAAFEPEGFGPGAANNSDAIVIFPNPANDAVHIGVPPSEVETTIDLIDGMGRTVVSMTQANASGQSNVIMDVSDRPNGVYLVRAVQGDRVTVERLAVQH